MKEEEAGRDGRRRGGGRERERRGAGGKKGGRERRMERKGKEKEEGREERREGMKGRKGGRKFGVHLTWPMEDHGPGLPDAPGISGGYTEPSKARTPCRAREPGGTAPGAQRVAWLPLPSSGSPSLQGTFPAPPHGSILPNSVPESARPAWGSGPCSPSLTANVVFDRGNTAAVLPGTCGLNPKNWG